MRLCCVLVMTVCFELKRVDYENHVIKKISNCLIIISSLLVLGYSQLSSAQVVVVVGAKSTAAKLNKDQAAAFF